jgi:hypothetical protein
MTTIKQLIKMLSKYPGSSRVGYYPTNAHGRGAVWRITDIHDVEFCDDKTTVAIVGGFE